MITDTFDNLSEEIIRVNRNDNAVKVDACILTFSHATTINSLAELLPQ